MKQNWTYKKLGEVGNVVGGSTPKTEIAEFWNGELPWITPAELTDSKYVRSTKRAITETAVEKTNLTLLPAGTVLLSSRAPIGKVGITTIPMYCNQGFKNIICTKELNNEFLYWWLKGKNDYLNSLGVGATFKEISKRIVEQITIPVPPLAEQQRIVSELDLLQGIMDKQQVQLKELDTLAQSIFYDMFGDPVENEKGWEVKRLGDVCIKITDGVHAKPTYTEFGMPFISVVNINRGVLDFNNCKFVSQIDGETFNKRANPQKGDILYTKVGATYGIPAVVDTDKEFCLYVSVCLIKPKHNIIDSVFLKNQMGAPYVKEQADKRIRGIGVPDLHLNQISDFEIVLPPLTLQQEFAEKIEKIERQKTAISQSIAETRKLFDYTMDKYFG